MLNTETHTQAHTLFLVLTLDLCRSSCSPRRRRRPRWRRAPRNLPGRSTWSWSARSQKPPPAWCRAAPLPGTSMWRLPRRRSGEERQRRRRQSGREKRWEGFKKEMNLIRWKINAERSAGRYWSASLWYVVIWPDKLEMQLQDANATYLLIRERDRRGRGKKKDS